MSTNVSFPPVADIGSMGDIAVMTRRTILGMLLAAIIGLCIGFWFRGFVDSDSCYDAGGVWESRGGYCYGARLAES